VKLTKLTIHKREWLRGESGHNSYLRRSSDGKMCCLGIYLRACGVEVDDLTDVRSPARVAGGLPGTTWWLNRLVSNELMSINDESTISETEREIELTKRFGENGIQVVFTD